MGQEITVRSLDNRIQTLAEYDAALAALIRAATEAAKFEALLKKNSANKLSALELNGLRSCILFQENFIRELRDTTVVSPQISLKLVSKLL